MVEKIINSITTFMSGGTTSIIIGILLMFSPIIGFIAVKAWNAWKAKVAYQESQDNEVSDSQDAIKDNLSKDAKAGEAADTVDDWANQQRNKGGKDG